MKILYHIPHLKTISAGRTIYAGYKHAFEDLGHQFFPLTVFDDQKEILEKVQPDILITSLNSYNLRYLNLKIVEQFKKRGLRVFVNTPSWVSPISKLRINESPSLSKNKAYINLIKSGKFGDVYFNVCEQDDPRMDGFERTTGYQHYTIPLAADKTMHFPEYSDKFKADISYIGTYLPEKKRFFKEQVFPLKKRYDLKIYGQDWTFFDRAKNLSQKIGQYFNIPYLRSFRKPKLELGDERKIYTSSTISINVHEDYQKQFGGDCNERVFKIPICAGFEITDDVSCIRKYFKDGEEIIIAKDKNDWFEKIKYYIKNPEKRLKIIKAGRERVLREHTYHNRVQKVIEIYSNINNFGPFGLSTNIWRK